MYASLLDLMIRIGCAFAHQIHWSKSSSVNLAHEPKVGSAAPVRKFLVNQ
jgi:hypothetical protein